MKLLFAILSTTLLFNVVLSFGDESMFRYTRGWVQMGESPLNEKVDVMFAIRQNNLRQLESRLLDVSDPRSSNYGRYLTWDEVFATTANINAFQSVMSWLNQHQVPATSIQSTLGHEFIRVQLPIALASQMFQTQFHAFRHPALQQSQRIIHRAANLHMPAAIASHVDFVSGLTRFPTVRTDRLQRTVIPQASFRVGAFPPGFTYPQILYKYYNISTPYVTTPSANQSVFETIDQSYTPSDLTLFQQTMNITVQPIAQVIGPNQANSCASNPDNCAEASLDVQYIMAVAQKSPTVYWSIPSSDQQPYLDFLYAIANTQYPPLVHSISYGDVEAGDDPSLMSRFNDEVIKLSVRGITVVVASGDDGVANFPARGNASACGFFPAFPASAPYVTAVGATQGPENNTYEVACTSSTGGGITTGGGFSNVFAQPSYQTSAVSQYFETAVLPPNGLWNNTGRGYPDVAMMGHNYIVVDGGQFTGGSGTSASAPVFAAVVTLANSARILNGKSPLGFVNPVLYQLAANHPEVFHDITSGENNCAAGDPSSAVCCQYGFYAAPGWDAVSGLGSINVDAFLSVVANL